VIGRAPKLGGARLTNVQANSEKDLVFIFRTKAVTQLDLPSRDLALGPSSAR